MAHTLIDQDAFERALNEAAASSPDDMSGLFGPSSMMWQVGREAIVFLCAGRAALLQSAHPFVAVAIDQHSDVKNDPRSRFKRTFINVFDMVFGQKNEALTRARNVRTIHDHIHGTLKDEAGAIAAGTPYIAHDRESVQWVHATLAESALKAYEIFHGPLSAEDREHYWQDSLRFAALFGLEKETMPATWRDFDLWWHQELNGPHLHITAEANSICDSLLLGKGATRALPKWYVALTAGFLPPHLREAYGLTFGPIDRRRAETAINRFTSLYPALPRKLKYTPAYHKALARMDGKPTPDIVTRGLEKLWLGL